jgi:hypothetical protein
MSKITSAENAQFGKSASIWFAGFNVAAEATIEVIRMIFERL